MSPLSRNYALGETKLQDARHATKKAHLIVFKRNIINAKRAHLRKPVHRSVCYNVTLHMPCNVT